MNLSEPAVSRRDLAGSLTLAVAWIFVTGIGLFLKPDVHGHGTHQQLGLPPCPSVLLFDRPCPGCGLTTSWTAFLHGDFAMAFHAHALGPLLYLGYSAFSIATLWFWATKRRWRDARWITPGFACLFGVFVSYGLVRMAVTPHYAMAKEQSLRALVGR